MNNARKCHGDHDIFRSQWHGTWLLQPPGWACSWFPPPLCCLCVPAPNSIVLAHCSLSGTPEASSQVQRLKSKGKKHILEKGFLILTRTWLNRSDNCSRSSNVMHMEDVDNSFNTAVYYEFCIILCHEISAIKARPFWSIPAVHSTYNDPGASFTIPDWLHLHIRLILVLL